MKSKTNTLLSSWPRPQHWHPLDTPQEKQRFWRGIVASALLTLLGVILLQDVSVSILLATAVGISWSLGIKIAGCYFGLIGPLNTVIQSILLPPFTMFLLTLVLIPIGAPAMSVLGISAQDTNMIINALNRTLSETLTEQHHAAIGQQLSVMLTMGLSGSVSAILLTLLQGIVPAPKNAAEKGCD